MLIGFIFSIFPASIAISTKTVFLEEAFQDRNGSFKYYYTIKLNSPNSLNINFLQELCKTNFVKSSAIIENIDVNKAGMPPFSIVALLNDTNWHPPLIKGRYFKENEKNSLIMGKDIYSVNSSDFFKLYNKNYKIIGVSGLKDKTGYDEKIFIKLNDMPNDMLEILKSQPSLNISVRSNYNAKTEINNFVSNLNKVNLQQKVKIVDENNNNNISYESLQELLGAPIRLVLIAMINLVIVSYLWIYTKRKDISLRKALGASNIDIIMYIWGQIFICSLVSALMTFLIQHLLYKANITIQNFDVQISPQNILIGLIFSLLLSIITSSFPIIHIIKLQSAEILNEKG
ncbi:ABC transporter permease [Clostridium kluyveri]|uniref:ABC transporter permease n=1 Tax=Clostridium kluyveri TaxID=1534 RepID=UPI001A9A4FFF|nr:ABC transporter permease [Clostridium kluyveri]